MDGSEVDDQERLDRPSWAQCMFEIALVIVFAWIVAVLGQTVSRGADHSPVDTLPNRPFVVVYAAPGCGPCKRAIADLQKVADIRVETDCPAWVTQVPTLMWKRGNQWVQHAPSHWSGGTWTSEWPRARRLIEGAR